MVGEERKRKKERLEAIEGEKKSCSMDMGPTLSKDATKGKYSALGVTEAVRRKL